MKLKTHIQKLIIQRFFNETIEPKFYKPKQFKKNKPLKQAKKLKFYITIAVKFAISKKNWVLKMQTCLSHLGTTTDEKIQ